MVLQANLGGNTHFEEQLFSIEGQTLPPWTNAA